MLSINTAALQHNYSVLSRETPAAAVVKANAYGLGIEIAVPAFYQAGCRQFFVAYPQEGIALRQCLQAFSKEPVTIYVLNGFGNEAIRTFAEYSLSPVINTLAQLAALPDDWPLVLQVETGMNRSGISGAEAASITRPVDLLMSHLACADDPFHSLNASQLAQFQRLRSQLKPKWASLAASSGILLGKDYHFDLTRPGIGLYGGVEHPDIQQVVTWAVPILEIRCVPAGQTVGYSGTWTAKGDRYIATLAAGYADGYPRALSNKGKVEINGMTLPLIGRVSMDLITVDVTLIIKKSAEKIGLSTVFSNTQDTVDVDTYLSLLGGTTATLYGSHYTINDAARDANTISYETLTRIASKRC